MAINMKELMDAADSMRESLPVIARLLRAYYNELLAAGFSKKEALKLVAAHGILPGRPLK